jgi:hypothetical protein
MDLPLTSDGKGVKSGKRCDPVLDCLLIMSSFKGFSEFIRTIYSKQKALPGQCFKSTINSSALQPYLASAISGMASTL